MVHLFSDIPLLPLKQEPVRDEQFHWQLLRVNDGVAGVWGQWLGIHGSVGGLPPSHEHHQQPHHLGSVFPPEEQGLQQVKFCQLFTYSFPC